jgi:hypothetical protein
MPDPTGPYIPHQPGDLITAEDWNNLQTDVRQDMAAKITSAIATVKDVDHAKAADKLGDMTLADITKHILDLAFAQIPKRTGYMQVFLNLKVGVSKNVAHNLKAFPVVDVYQLLRFDAVCATDDTSGDARRDQALFYLYHASERRIYFNKDTPVDIERDDRPKFRIVWKNLIDQLVEAKLLEYTDDTTIDELEVNFWKALFASPPNDDFDPDAYCHSPWFEKCCGEKRTVGDLVKHGDFKNLYLKMEPVKTVNWDPEPTVDTHPADPGVWPANVIVAQADLDTLALVLAAPVPIQKDITPLSGRASLVGAQSMEKRTNGDPVTVLTQDTLPIMLLLKV